MSVKQFDIWRASLPLALALLAPQSLRRYAFGAFALQAAWIGWGVANVRNQFFGPCFYRNRSFKGAMALTFDDGPDPALTPEILDIMQEHMLKATFFVVAKRAQRAPALIRRTQREGHVIACHDLNHNLSANFRRYRTAKREIAAAAEIIADIIGKRPCFYRPPSGLINPHIMRATAELGLTCIGWSVSTNDAGNRRPKRIRKIPELCAPGEVALCHDILPKPAYKDLICKQVRGLCRRLNEKGIQSMGIDAFFGMQAYYE